MKKVSLTTMDLRRNLLKDIHNVRKGKMADQQARTLSTMYREILHSVDIEIKACKVNGTKMKSIKLI